MSLKLPYGLMAAALFGFISGINPFALKVVVKTYRFKFPFALLACRMLLGSLIVEVLRLTKLVDIPAYSLVRGRRFLAASVCNAIYIVVIQVSLVGISIPMYAAIRQCVPLVTLVLTVAVLRKPWPSCSIVCSVAIITTGCVLAGFGDLTFDTVSYVTAALSAVILGLYQTLIQRASENNLSVVEIFQLTCFNCLPMAVGCSVVAGEVQKLINFDQYFDIEFLAYLLLACSTGLAVNFSAALCTALNSALTTSFVGVLKNIPQTIVGYFTFGGLPYDLLNILGLIVNTFGGFMFTYGKYKERQEIKRTTEIPEIVSKTTEDTEVLLLHKKSHENVKKNLHL